MAPAGPGRHDRSEPVSPVLRTRRVALAGLLALLAVFPLAASADARQELHAAYRKMMALKAFKTRLMDLSTGKTAMTMEYQAPDRYRMTLPGQPPQLIIGDTMLMTVDGRTLRVPLPKGSLPKVRNEEGLRELERGSLVEAQGAGVVGGQPARIYRHTTQVNGKPAQTLVWVGVASGLPLQVETRGAKGGKDMRLLYSDFDSAKIRIVAPK
jgi:outer membrane lipoprotein-sorting protein